MDYFEADVDKSTCLHATSSRRESWPLWRRQRDLLQILHGAVSYTLNGENVNVMLESEVDTWVEDHSGHYRFATLWFSPLLWERNTLYNFFISSMDWQTL